MEKKIDIAALTDVASAKAALKKLTHKKSRLHCAGKDISEVEAAIKAVKAKLGEFAKAHEAEGATEEG